MNLLAIGWSYLQLILFTHLITVLMGAPFIDDMFRTFLFSFWLVFIGFSPLIISLRGNLRQIYSILWHENVQWPNHSSTNSVHRLLMKNLAWATVLGAWCGAFAIPLDWDRWWQRWPITCLVSSTIGALLSPFVTFAWLSIRSRSHLNKNSE